LKAIITKSRAILLYSKSSFAHISTKRWNILHACNNNDNDNNNNNNGNKPRYYNIWSVFFKHLKINSIAFSLLSEGDKWDGLIKWLIK